MAPQEELKFKEVAKAAKLLLQSERDFPKNRIQHTIYKTQLDTALKALEQ
jgi:hypothetical protein